MFQGFNAQRGPLPVANGGDSPVSIIGAGIAGAWQALLFAQAGHAVTLYERSDAAMTLATSHWAGGMLAPWCEAEASEETRRGEATGSAAAGRHIRCKRDKAALTRPRIGLH